jgi:RNA polymerase sigma factor (sigma-70 family)
MSASDPITHWLTLLRAGDASAAQPLWEHYFRRLVGLARARLGSTPRRAADEEDVALSAFDSFVRGVERGRFPRLADRNNLWRVLVVLTARKAADLRARERRLKRGGGDAADDAGLEDALGREPTPEFAALTADELRLLLDRLGEPELRSIALWKLEGYTNAEIAERVGCAPPTVERRLRLIRSVWADRAPPEKHGPA